MKKNITRGFVIAAIFVMGALIGSPLIASAVAVTGWVGTASIAVTDPLVVSVTGGSPLSNPYGFAPVSLKVGDTKVYNLTVTNTGTTTQMVRPLPIITPSPDILTEWTVGASGRSIAGGLSADFVFKITAVNVTTSPVGFPISFTREQL
jgi:hypothetical protein